MFVPRISVPTIAVAMALLPAVVVAQEAAPMGEMAPEPIVVGDLTITLPWARATPPGAVTGAGYLTITNNGTSDETLLAVTSDIAEVNEVHEMTMADDRMVMRPLEEGLLIAAGETVVLQPGGFHLMFVQLAAGFVEGTDVAITLIFEVAGEIDINLIVFPIGSDGPAGAMGGMEMGGMGGMGAGDGP